jgi:hypothetical protein
VVRGCLHVTSHFVSDLQSLRQDDSLDLRRLKEVLNSALVNCHLLKSKRNSCIFNNYIDYIGSLSLKVNSL